MCRGPHLTDPRGNRQDSTRHAGHRTLFAGLGPGGSTRPGTTFRRGAPGRRSPREGHLQREAEGSAELERQHEQLPGAREGWWYWWPRPGWPAGFWKCRMLQRRDRHLAGDRLAFAADSAGIFEQGRTRWLGRSRRLAGLTWPAYGARFHATPTGELGSVIGGMFPLLFCFRWCSLRRSR